MMRLENGDRASVDNAKLIDYVLSPTHPVGRHHAVLFERLLGIGRHNATILKDALLSTARDHEVEPGHASPFGRKFEMRVPVTGPLGTRNVLAVWLIETGTDRPRLITCYVE